ncbi:2914_t:CDS:1, partial [Entrophospora sp. SA101]
TGLSVFFKKYHLGLATNVIKDHETMDCPFLWKDSTDPRTVHRQAGRLGSLDIPNN